MNLRFFYILILSSLVFSACTKISTAPDPNTAIVWVVGDQTVMKSRNAGQDWINYGSTQIDQLYSAINDDKQVFHSISFYNTNSGSISADECSVFSTNNALRWNGGRTGQYPSPSVINSSVMLDSNLVFYCGEYSELGYISRFNDSYSSKKLTPAVFSNFHGIDFINSSMGWVVGDNSVVLYTADKGQTWSQQTTASGNIYNAVRIHSVSASLIETWLVGNNGVIFKTSDKGVNWISKVSGTTANLTSICFTGNDIAYISGSGGTILKTSDNGVSFQFLTSGTTENLNSISFMDENFGFAVGDKGTFLKTVDAGKTWSQVSWDNSKNLYGVCFVKRF